MLTSLSKVSDCSKMVTFLDTAYFGGKKLVKSYLFSGHMGQNSPLIHVALLDDILRVE